MYKNKRRKSGWPQISFRSSKNYSVDEKLIEVVSNIAPLKSGRIENTSSEWFDWEITEKLSIRDKLFKKFKSSHLNIDLEIYKAARNDVQRTIKQQEKKVFGGEIVRKYS